MIGQYCFIPKILRMKPITWLMGNIIPKFMHEYLSDILNYNLRISSRAYVEIKAV